MMLLVRVADQVFNMLNYTDYIDQTRYTSKDVARNIAIADNLLTARLVICFVTGQPENRSSRFISSNEEMERCVQMLL